GGRGLLQVVVLGEPPPRLLNAAADVELIVVFGGLERDAALPARGELAVAADDVLLGSRGSFGGAAVRFLLLFLRCHVLDDDLVDVVLVHGRGLFAAVAADRQRRQLVEARDRARRRRLQLSQSVEQLPVLL